MQQLKMYENKLWFVRPIWKCIWGEWSILRLELTTTSQWWVSSQWDYSPSDYQDDCQGVEDKGICQEYGKMLEHS